MFLYPPRGRRPERRPPGEPAGRLRLRPPARRALPLLEVRQHVLHRRPRPGSDGRAPRQLRRPPARLQRRPHEPPPPRHSLRRTHRLRRPARLEVRADYFNLGF